MNQSRIMQRNITVTVHIRRMFIMVLLQLIVVCFSVNDFQVAGANESDTESTHYNPCLLTWTRPLNRGHVHTPCGCGPEMIEGEPTCELRPGPVVFVVIYSKYCMTLMKNRTPHTWENVLITALNFTTMTVIPFAFLRML